MRPPQRRSARQQPSKCPPIPMGAGSQVFCVRSQAWGEPLWRDAGPQRAGAVCSMTGRAALIGLLVLIAVPAIAVAAETGAAAAAAARAGAQRWETDAPPARVF